MIPTKWTRRIKRLVRTRSPPFKRPVVLMYHRIADCRPDPWGLCVTPKLFHQQMAAIRKYRLPMAMDELILRLRRGRLPNGAVGVTFDDGYVDNFLQAKPILEELGVPATVFLTTGAIGSGQEFWWDELARIIFDPNLPLPKESPLSTILTRAPQLAAISSKLDAECQPTLALSTDRLAVYHQIWEKLYRASPEDRGSLMQQLRESTTIPLASPEDLPMSESQALELQSDLITIGAHTHSHPALIQLEAPQRQWEIESSRDYCLSLSRKPVTGFAFPHGSLDEESKSLVANAGFEWACSTRSTFISPQNVDVYELPRLAVGNWNGNELLRRMRWPAP